MGSGLLILLDVHTPPAAVVFIFMCAGAGQGLLFSSQASVMQATCSNENAVQSMCMYSFMRSWGLCLGVVLGGTVVQNFLRMRLSYQDLPTGSAADIDGLIPLLQSLPNSSPLRALLPSAYAWALQKLFITNTAVSFMGGLMTLFIPDYSIDTLGHMGQTAQIFHIDSTVGSRTHAPRT